MLPHPYPNITHISKQFKGILLDAAGVFWGGNDIGLLPGSKEIMEQLISQGKVVGILSNSTQLAAKEINKYERAGIILNKHFHFLLTSGEVARNLFLSKKLPFKTSTNKFFLLGEPHPKYFSHEAIFQDTIYSVTKNINDADFIFISIPHINGEDQTDPQLFVHELKKIKEKNLPMICANPDLFAHEGKPPKRVVRQGSIAALYEEMDGKVIYIGKPHSLAYTSAMEHLQQIKMMQPSEVLMVGDTPETDIRGARQHGISSALITHTGIMAERISLQGIDNAFKALPTTDYPQFLINRL